MKKQNHLLQLVGSTMLAAALVAANSAKSEIVYSNTNTPNPLAQLFVQSGYEFGDEVVLGGGQTRYLTNFVIQYFGSNFNGSSEKMCLRLYRNDGTNYGTNFNVPGTMLYDSGFFPISATTGMTLSFSQADANFSVPVPTNFTWTVEFSGLTNGVQEAGLFLYDPITIGYENYDQFWELSGINSSWVYRDGAGTNLNFAAQASAATYVADAVPPTVTISSPGNNGKAYSPNFTQAVTVSGKAKDLVKLGLVLYKMGTDNNYKPATTADGWLHWTATNAVWIYGPSNFFYVKSVDAAGNESTVASRQFNLKVTNLLTLNVSSPVGTSNYITKPTSLASGWAEVGKAYTITAKIGPDGKCLFSNWTSFTAGYDYTNAKYKFTMTTNLTLTANFVTNRFFDVAGSYQGLFTVGGVVDFTNSGYFEAKITAKAGKQPSFTTKVTVDGKKWGGSGKFQLNGTGALNKPISRVAQGKTSLFVNLTLPFDGDDTLGGTVSATNGSWVSDIDANRALVTNVYDGLYTMVVPGFSTNIGDGYGLLTITNGTIKLTGGKLADNQSFKQTSLSVSKHGEWPLFSTGDKLSGIYNSLIMGWVTVSNSPNLGLSTSNLVWIKKSGLTTYPLGFTTNVGLEASPYSDPGSVLVMPLSGLNGTNGVVYLSNGGVTGGLLTNTVSLSVASLKNKFVITNKVYKLSLSLVGKTGKLSGGFTDNLVKGTIGGVVLTNQSVGKGYFLLPKTAQQSGTFLLE